MSGTPGQVDALVDEWRRLASDESRISGQAYDRRHAALVATTRETTADAAGRSAVLEVARTTTDERLRDDLLGAVLPDATPLRVLTDRDAFRRHPEVAMTAEELPIAPALPLIAHGVGYADIESFRSWVPDVSVLTWFCGGPAVPADEIETCARPSRSDGRELDFVVQVDLTARVLEDPAEVEQGWGLPVGGLLQLFHDLESTGWGDEADDSHACVRWLPMVEPDPDLLRVDPAHARELVPVVSDYFATAPNPLDAPDHVDAERYERVWWILEEGPYLFWGADGVVPESLQPKRSPWDEDYRPGDPVSRVGGYPASPTTEPDFRRRLHQRLPLDGGDRHVLLLDLSPAGFGKPDWFHGRRLEVWTRRSDVVRRDFSSAWAVIRTDA